VETLILILGLLLFGSYKKDFTALVFAGVGFIIYGLGLYTTNFEFGAISMGFGAYVAIRSAIDLITIKNNKEVE
jgi:hypothetical protein